MLHAVFARPTTRLHAWPSHSLGLQAGALDGHGLTHRRIGLVSMDDVGVATVFLAHDAARLITGETLYIDGGYHIMD